MNVGVPVCEQPTEAERFRKKTSVPASLSVQELEDFVVQLYPRVPQLQRIGFTFMKSLKNKALVVLTGDTTAALRSELKRSTLFILPRRDLQMVCIRNTVYRPTENGFAVTAEQRKQHRK